VAPLACSPRPPGPNFPIAGTPLSQCRLHRSQPRGRTLTPNAMTYAAASKVAARQHDLITLPQLRRIGVTDKRLTGWKRDELIVRVERQVYSLATGLLSWHARLLSLCFASGGIASHRSAAAIDKLEGCHPGAPELTIPRGRSFRRPGVRVHESRDFEL